MRNWLIVLLSVCSIAQAGIYKTYDKNGNPVFTDAPSADAQEVEDKPVLTVPALSRSVIEQKTQPLTKNTSATEPADYKVSFTNIKANDSLRKEDKAVSAGVVLEPPLWREHHLLISLDGKQISKDGFSAMIDPEKLERGQHRLEVAIINNKSKVLRTEVLDFFIQQVSVANKKK